MARGFLAVGAGGASARLRRLLLSAALLPLMHAAAVAETVVSTAVTVPVATSSPAGAGADDVTVSSAGSIALSAPGAALTIDSDSRASNYGALSANNLSDTTGGLALGGRSGLLENFGTISLLEDYAAADADADGDLDGAFAQAARRYGLRVAGSSPFAGSVLNGGAITVEGNDSAGVSVESRLQGVLTVEGTVSVTGDRSTGFRADEVAGPVRIGGAVSVLGEGATGVSLGRVEGGVVLQGAVSATGYRYVDRLTDAVRAKLDADDLKQGGPAVRIAGSVSGGVILETAPADLDANVADEDGDGLTDATEGAAVLTSYGGAPALDLGGSGDTSFGRVREGDKAFGLVVKGQVIANGVNDGVAATALRVGQPDGGRTALENGLNILGGTVTANAYSADATAIALNPGADAGTVRNSGVLTATSITGGADAATALMIAPGATTRTFSNAGLVSASVDGAIGTAQAVVDRSGSLVQVENTGKIQASVATSSGATITGRSIALDLSANTTGVLVRQTGVADGDDGADGVADADADGDGVDDADEPLIQGEVLLGAGADRLELLNGRLVGPVSFGAGADSLVIDGGAQLTGDLYDADGRLAIEVRKGALALVSTGAVPITSLTLGPEATLSVPIDPASGSSASLQASGQVTIDPAAKIVAPVKSLLTAPQSFEIIRAGALSADGVGGPISAPFLYSAIVRADAAAGRVYVDLRPKTAAELGLLRSEGQALEAVYAAGLRNASIGSALAGKTTQAEFTVLYDQLLPEHSGVTTMTAAALGNALNLAVRQGPPRGTDPGGSAIWGQEIYYELAHDGVGTPGYRARTVGLAAGYERSTQARGAIGFALSLASTDSSDRGAATGERTVTTFAGGSLYLRQQAAGLTIDVRAGAGVVSSDSERRIVSAADELDLTAKADWLGWMADAHLGLGYDLRLGRLYLRPRGELDYLRLKEPGYTETGGGDGVDLKIDSRTGSFGSATASLSLGFEFGGDFRWGPELTVGRRERLLGGPAQTVGRFVDGGPDFILDPETPYRSTTILRGGFRGTGLGTTISLEGGLEQAGAYKQWDLRAVAKFAF